jgi:uncharacterized membrane protein YcfT
MISAVQNHSPEPQPAKNTVHEMITKAGWCDRGIHHGLVIMTVVFVHAL